MEWAVTVLIVHGECVAGAGGRPKGLAYYMSTMSGGGSVLSYKQMARLVEGLNSRGVTDGFDASRFWSVEQ